MSNSRAFKATDAELEAAVARFGCDYCGAGLGEGCVLPEGPTFGPEAGLPVAPHTSRRMAAVKALNVEYVAAMFG